MRKLSLEKKLMATIGTMLLLLVALSFFSFRTIDTLGSRLDEGLNISARRLDLFNAVRARMQELIANTRAAQLANAAKDPAAIGEFRKRFDAAAKRAKEMTDDLRPSMQSTEEQQMSALLDKNLRDLIFIGKQAIEVDRNESSAAVHLALTRKISAQIENFETASVAFSRSQRASIATSGKEAVQEIQQSKVNAYVLIGLVFALAILVVLTIHRSAMNLRKIAADLSQSADEVTHVASEVASSSNQVARGASAQASCVEETSTSTKELSAIMHEHSAHAKASLQTLTATKAAVHTSRTTLKEMTASMADLHAATARITSITSVIETIAFQTNILALNAAVEASRAGDAGAGFAVVADEVRNLARRSSAAANDIASLVGDSLTKSKTTAERFANLSRTIESFAETSSEVHRLVENIAKGSEQQEAGIEQILKAMTQIENVVQTNAAAAQETASISEEMSAQAHALSQLGENLSCIVNGAG